MPLQWLPLRERQPQRSVVSQALTPRKGGVVSMGGMPVGEGFIERERRLQEEEAKRKHELKLMDKQLEIAKFAAGMKEDTAKGITPMTAGQALRREPAPAETPVPATTEPKIAEDAIMKEWEFILSLDPEGQKFYIQQLKQKELGTGGYIESKGKRVEMPGSVGKYYFLADRGLLDPTTDTVIKKERLFEKGTFEIIEKGGTIYRLNTATQETTILGTVDEPERTVAEIDKQANDDANAKTKLDPTTNFEDNKYDSLKDAGVNSEVAKDWAKVEKIPKDKKTPLRTRIINWLKGIKKTPIGAGMGAYREGAVTALMPQMTGIDTLTATHYSHWEAEGATRAEIDEAFRRAKGEK